MTQSLEGKIWETLSAINVNDKVEKKNGLTYLSWAWAWGVLMDKFPQSSYVINEPEIESDGSMMVSVTLTIKDGENQASRYMWLPVMDYKNQAIKAPNSVDINKAVMRCLTKAISMFGLGFYIYAGEDLPETEKEAKKADKQESEKKYNALIAALDAASQKGVDAMQKFWEALNTEDVKILGEENKQKYYRVAKAVTSGTTTKN